MYCSVVWGEERGNYIPPIVVQKVGWTDMVPNSLGEWSVHKRPSSEFENVDSSESKTSDKSGTTTT